MTGQIPKYGDYFRRESVGYEPGMSSTSYVLKTDEFWHIRAAASSKKWWVFWRGEKVVTGAGFGTLSEAMRACKGAAVALKS